jgi:hypothetical protein
VKNQSRNALILKQNENDAFCFACALKIQAGFFALPTHVGRKNGKDKYVRTVLYNHKITVSGIPVSAYDYVVNGKPAMD